MLQETKAGTTITYVPGVSQHDPSHATEPARWSYFHADAQNNRLLTDGSGAVSHRWEYDPFGNVRDESGPARSEFGYADEQRDGETGLVNLRARYYDPGLGRFLSRDAFGGLDADPQGWNRYSYVENNPITRTDPSGHYGRGLPNAQVRALQQDWRAGRFSSESLAQIRRLTKDQYRWATAGLPRGVKKRLDRIAEPNEKEDDSKRSRLRKSCSNPGQYTGSCPGGPPNPAYVADQLAAEQAKILGRAAQRRREVADNATVHAATTPDELPVYAMVLGGGCGDGVCVSQVDTSDMPEPLGGDELDWSDDDEADQAAAETECEIQTSGGSVVNAAGCTNQNRVGNAVVQPPVRAGPVSVAVPMMAAPDPGGSGGSGVGDDLPKGGTYLLRDRDSGEVVRTGRTKNLARRQGEHSRDPVLAAYRFDIDRRTNDYAEQRGREQIIYDTYSGARLNKVRPISPRNRNLERYLEAGRRL